MASSSNQIQADIAQTRARIDHNLDAIEANPQATLQSLTAGVTNIIRRRPLTTLGFSLFAGALLQDLLGGAQGSTSVTTTVPSTSSTSLYPASSGTASYGTSGLDTATGAVGAAAQRVGQGTQQAASTVANTASNAASTVADTASSVANTATSAVSTAADAASNAASTAVDTAANVASTAVDTAASAASAVGNTAANVATTVADTASSAATTVVDTAASAATTVGNIASEVGTTVADTTVSVTNRLGEALSNVGETLSNAGKQVVSTASNLGTTVNQQVQQRPLTVLGVSIGVGALLQPTLAPTVGRVTDQVQDTASSIGNNVSQLQANVASALTLPNQQDVERIQQALVPAVVERAKKLTSRDLRDYLDNRLEPIVTQASLRAGIVAAVTDRTSEAVQNRLPGVLNSTLSGTRTLVVASILGAVLDAYTKAQQGEGKTTEIVRRDLADTLTETSTQQLQRYFPEFREQYQNLESQSL